MSVLVYIPRSLAYKLELTFMVIVFTKESVCCLRQSTFVLFYLSVPHSSIHSCQCPSPLLIDLSVSVELKSSIYPSSICLCNVTLGFRSHDNYCNVSLIPSPPTFPTQSFFEIPYQMDCPPPPLGHRSIIMVDTTLRLDGILVVEPQHFII